MDTRSICQSKLVQGFSLEISNQGNGNVNSASVNGLYCPWHYSGTQEAGCIKRPFKKGNEKDGCQACGDKTVFRRSAEWERGGLWDIGSLHSARWGRYRSRPVNNPAK